MFIAIRNLIVLITCEEFLLVFQNLSHVVVKMIFAASHSKQNGIYSSTESTTTWFSCYPFMMEVHSINSVFWIVITFD